MLWDLLQQWQIGRAQRDAKEARGEARTAAFDVQQFTARIRSLEEQVDRLTLALSALGEIARERLGLTDDDFAAKLREIDLRDGKLDGKLRLPNKSCPACGRINSAVRSTCLYCGVSLPHDAAILAPSSQPHD